MNSLSVTSLRGFKCGKSTSGDSWTATSVIACAHRGRITKDARLVREMHRMIKGKWEVGAQEIVRIPLEGGGTRGAKTRPGAKGDYMEEAHSRAVAL
jgi:hypothetical protein